MIDRDALARWLGPFLCAVGALAAAMFVAGLPYVRELPGWHYEPLGPHALSPSPFVLVALVLPIAAVLAMRAARAERTARAIGWLIAFSLAVQVATTAADESTLVYRLENGHGELLRIAHELCEREGVLSTLETYETAAEGGALGGFAPSKPQGFLLFYVGIELLGEWAPVRAALSPIASSLAPHESLRGRTAGAAAAVVLFPLLTALVVLPLFFLARALGARAESAVVSCLVWATVPSVALISYHADGSLGPLLSAGAAALATAAGRSALRGRGLALAALGGAVAGLAVFTNFSMLALVGLAAVLPFGASVERGGAAAGLRPGLERGAAAIAGATLVLGVLVASGLFAHPFDRFEGALAHHFRWTMGALGGRYGAMALAEFWAYAGFPLATAALLAFGPAVRRWLALVPRPGDSLLLVLVSIHLAMAATTGGAENARIWLWLVPLYVAPAVRALRSWSRPTEPEALASTLAIVQLGLLAVMRATQPW